MTYVADQLPGGLDDAADPLLTTDGLVGDQGGDAVRFTLNQILAAVMLYLGDSDPTLAPDSNDKLASKSAIKAYVDAETTARGVAVSAEASTRAAADTAEATARTQAIADAVAGLSWKTSARAATAAALPACTYANGSSGVGATLTGNANGALSAQDGVTLVANERLLVKDQVAGAQNGIYVLTQVGTGGTPFILTRATDADAAADIRQASLYIEEGTVAADKQYVLTTNTAITVGTTALVFAVLNTSTAFTGGTLTSALNEAPTVTIASSSTPAIGAAAGNSILLTGTTTVTGFDSIAAGAMRRVRFGGILTLTYNATSLILPTSANITTAADDVAEFLSLGSGNWFCTSYSRKNGAALVGSGGAVTVTTKGDLQGFSTIPNSVAVGTDGQVLTADSSAANGVSWQAAGGGLTRGLLFAAVAAPIFL